MEGLPMIKLTRAGSKKLAVMIHPRVIDILSATSAGSCMITTNARENGNNVLIYVDHSLEEVQDAIAEYKTGMRAAPQTAPEDDLPF
jgi:hypothetical protein